MSWKPLWVEEGERSRRGDGNSLIDTENTAGDIGSVDRNSDDSRPDDVAGGWDRIDDGLGFGCAVLSLSEKRQQGEKDPQGTISHGLSLIRTIIYALALHSHE